MWVIMSSFTIYKPFGLLTVMQRHGSFPTFSMVVISRGVGDVNDGIFNGSISVPSNTDILLIFKIFINDLVSSIIVVL